MMQTRRNNLNALKANDFKRANAGLWLDKYFGEGKEKEEGKTLVNQVASITVPEIYAAFYRDRWIKNLAEEGAKSKEVEVRGRMAVGLGADSVLETSITLHRTYGVPYIPASGLKGLCRRYARKHLQKKDNSGDWKEKHTEKLFGKTDEAGYIIFFDALYVPDSGHNGVPLHPDVMTVHHPEYYQSGKEPPADWDDPTPIPFLSATGKYLLAVAAPFGAEWIDPTLSILEKALSEEGVGAKTSSGYGFFTPNKSVEEKTYAVRNELAERFERSGMRVTKHK